MAEALIRAAEDCDGAAPGAGAPAGQALLRRAGSLRVVSPLGWHTRNPALQVAGRLGFAEGDEPSELMLTSVGGNTPQALMHDACRAISRGDLDVVLVTGAEAMYTRALSRRDRSKAPLSWATQPDDTADPVPFGVDKPGSSDLEVQRGLLLPVHAYPLFENALRAAAGAHSGRAHGARRRALVTLQRGGRRQPARLDPHASHRRRDREPRTRQQDDLLPVPEAVHGEPPGGPGRRVHRLLGGDGPGRGRVRGALGLPSLGGRRQRPLVRLGPARAAPLPCHQAGGRRPHWSWPESVSTTSLRWTSTRASRRWSRWRRPSSVCASTTPDVRSP